MYWMSAFLWRKVSEIVSLTVAPCLLCCWSLLTLWGRLAWKPLIFPTGSSSITYKVLHLSPLRLGCTVLLLINDSAIPAQFITIHFTMQYKVIQQHNRSVWRYYHCAMILDTIKIIRTYLSGIWGKSIRLTWIIAELKLRYNLLPLGAYMNTFNSQNSII